MPLLFSNFPPLKTGNKTYASVFRQYIEQADDLRIATGYISSDSAVDLKNIVEANGGPKLDLCIGMHYFEGLSPVQLNALTQLDKTLRDQSLGQVYMVTTFPLHAKVASFSKDGSVLASLIGSSNLTNIVFGLRQYEADYLIDNNKEKVELNKFIEETIKVASKPLSELDIFPKIPKNDLLKDQLGVEEVKQNEVKADKSQLSDLSFDIPLKGDISKKSGLNASFGKGRENQQGFVIPRSWYEVELIVPKAITMKTGYPKADSAGDGGVINIVTDDGWKFRCKVSGDFSKNLRSEDDLKILGKWIKGRLENAGVLQPGDRITDQVFEKYGRSSMQLTKIKDKDLWYLDFGV